MPTEITVSRLAQGCYNIHQASEGEADADIIHLCPDQWERLVAIIHTEPWAQHGWTARIEQAT